MLISTSNLFTRPGYAGAACKGSSQVSLPYPKCGPAVGMFPSIWKHTEACRLPGSSWKHLFHAENAHTIPCMEKYFQVFLSNSSCYEISGCWAIVRRRGLAPTHAYQLECHSVVRSRRHALHTFGEDPA